LIAAPGASALAAAPAPQPAATSPERRAEPAPAKRPPTIAPSRPVLVPHQSTAGRIAMQAESAPMSEPGDPLIELTSAGRGNAEQVVKEPPEPPAAPVVQIVRRVAGGDAVGPASTDG
jgi:hypothetical protein